MPRKQNMGPNSPIRKCSKCLWEDHTPAPRDGKPVCAYRNRPQYFLFPPAFGMLQSSLVSESIYTD